MRTSPVTLSFNSTTRWLTSSPGSISSAAAVLRSAVTTSCTRVVMLTGCPVTISRRVVTDPSVPMRIFCIGESRPIRCSISWILSLISSAVRGSMSVELVYTGTTKR